MPQLHRAFCKPTLLAFALVVALGAHDADAAPKKKKAPKAPAVSAECTDFYGSANATWLKANPLPAEAGSLTALGQLIERSQLQQRQLLDASMQSPQGNVQKLLGDFWASGLDEAAVEADGAKPIAPLLDRINGIKRSKDVPAAIAALHQIGIPVAFNFSPDVDLKALDRHIGYFSQGGLGLALAYKNYVKQILALTGTQADKLDAEANAVIDLETRIARVSRPLQDLRNPLSNYLPTPTKELGKTYRNLQLDAFLKAQGVSDDTVSMVNPALFAELNTLVGSLKPDQWKTYLRWQVGDTMAPYLAKSYRDASFEFRGRVLKGQAAPAPRWQHVLDAINTAAGPMLGREYAGRYLPAASKSKAEAIAQNVRDSLARGIERSSWMSASAKAEAKSKIDKLKIEIGTPRRDLDYSVQPMGRGSFGSNILIASTWRHREEMKRIGKGNADRRWDVLPQQPALAYDLAQNRLIVTAAVLQPPVFDVNRGDSALFGSYGALVGHELSRGFDVRGRMVDAGGELRDWWTPADVTAWNAIGARVAAQYSGYAYPGVANAKLNGKLTQDEDMADLVGVELAWDAFTNAQLAPNQGAKQTLFRSWSELWGQHVSPSESAQRIATDVHAPGQWRSNGPLANLPAFGESFNCKVGQPMRRSDAEQIS
ncbi:MAG: M13 family peptidase, partial [Lysobacteraceae bacterium]